MERAKLKLARIYAVTDGIAAAPPFQGYASSANDYLRGALDAVGAVVYTIDRSYRITTVNQEWDRFAYEHGGLAITSSAIIGKNLLDNMTGEPRETIRQACEAIFAGRLRRYTLEVDCSTSQSLIWCVEIAPIKAGDGQIIGASFCSRDVTALKLLEAEVAAQRGQLKQTLARENRRTELLLLLNQVGEHLASELRIPAIVDYVTSVLVERLGLTFARIWLYDNLTEELVLRSSSGLYTATTGTFSRIKLGQYRVGMIAESLQAFVTNDVASESGLGDRDWAEQTGIRSFAGYPLISRDRLLGVIGFFSRQPLDDELISMIEPFVHQVSLAIERAQLYVAQVAARREAQAHARIATEQATQLTATLAAMGDGVWTCGQRGELLTVNRAALMMLGLSDQQAQLATIDDIPALFTEDCADRDRCFGLRVALEGRSMRDELALKLQHRPQSPLVVAVTATPMRDSAGNVVGAVAVVRDVTQQKALEQLRIDFISAAAHELKTPMTTLKGYAQLALMRLRSNLDRPRLQRALQSIDIQADRVVHIVQKLLDATRMQVGLLDLQPEVLDLAALVRSCVEQSRAMSSRHTITIAAPSTLEVRADRLRITLVVQNMLDNAIKYSPDGGKIEVALEAKQGEALLTVRDHGVGVPREKQARIFEPWYQAHAETVGDVGGMGLGLSVSREIIEGHGGRMWCDSTEGAGSVFGCTLPLLEQ